MNITENRTDSSPTQSDRPRRFDQSINVHDYVTILIKHKLLIILILILSVLTTGYFTFTSIPIYQAKSTIFIDKERSRNALNNVPLGYETYYSQSLTFNTHFKLIKSRPIMEAVIKDLNLDRELNLEKSSPHPIKRLKRAIINNIFILLNKERKKKILTPLEKHEQLLETLKRKIHIEDLAETRLLEIYVDDPDPVVARDIANEISNVYIKYDIDSKMMSSRNTLNWMSEQLYETKKKLEKAEAEFLQYKQDEKIFSIQGKQNVITQKIQEFNDAYLKARNQRLELDAKLAELKRLLDHDAEVVRAKSLIDNPHIDTLYTQLLNSEVEYDRMRKVYREKHPKIVQLQSTIDNTLKKLEEELSKEIDSLKAERSVLFNREKVLLKTISDFERDALETNKKELTYSILERNVVTNRKLYDTLLSRVKEVNVEENLYDSNIRIAEKASIPLVPVRPRVKLNMLLSVVFGSFFGIGLVLLIEFLDQSIKTEEDVERFLGVPVLSVIPLSHQAHGSGYGGGKPIEIRRGDTGGGEKKRAM